MINFMIYNLSEGIFMDIREYDIKALAYIGDAVYELYVREHLMKNSHEQVNKLHKKAIKYVSAKAQALVIQNVEESFDEELLAIFKRGRNAFANTVPKNTDVVTYKVATGFEAVVGYLYLTGSQRLNVFLEKSIEIIENNIKSAI